MTIMEEIIFVFAILHTSDMTIEKIRTEFTEISEEEALNLAKIFAMMDSKKALLLPDFGSDDYCFIALADLNANKELSYQMEQDSFVGCYINQREEFDADYDSDEYSRDVMFCINKSHVEVISREEWECREV